MTTSAKVSFSHQHDKQLLHAAGCGDAAAWAVLVERHCELVWTLAVRLVGTELGGVVSQLVWLRLAGCLGGPYPSGGTTAWLRRAVWDECGRQRVREGLPPAD